ncbi:MAG: hypothetical protein WC444_06770 [Candidatus Paceibacterota bacterium]
MGLGDSLMSGIVGGATVGIVIKAYDQFSDTFNRAETGMTKLGMAARVGGIALTAAAAGLFTFGVSSVKAAANAEVMTAQFKKMAQNSDDLLVSLNNATHETVTDFELMSSANKALALGIEQNKLPEFFERAAILGQLTGRSVTEAVGDITLGVGRQSKLILDNLGIIVDAEAAYQNYANVHGTVAAALTETQKKEAFLQATLEGMKKTIEDNGLVFEESLSVKLAKVNKQFSDLKVQVGNELIPTLTELADVLIEHKDDWIALGQAAGKVLSGMLTGIGWVIDKVGDLGAKLGNVIGLAKDVFTADSFADIKMSAAKRANINDYINAGYSAEDAMRVGGSSFGGKLMTAAEYGQIQAEKAAGGAVTGNAIPGLNGAATIGGGSVGGGTGTDVTTQHTEAIDSDTRTIKKSEEAKINLMDNEYLMGETVKSMTVLYQEGIISKDADVKAVIKATTAQESYSNCLEQLDSQTRKVVEAMVKAQVAMSGGSGGSKSSRGSSGGVSYKGGSGSSTGDPSQSNVVWDIGTQTYMTQTESAKRSGYNPALHSGNVTNNYYTTDNSSKSKRVTGVA